LRAALVAIGDLLGPDFLVLTEVSSVLCPSNSIIHYFADAIYNRCLPGETSESVLALLRGAGCELGGAGRPEYRYSYSRADGTTHDGPDCATRSSSPAGSSRPLDGLDGWAVRPGPAHPNVGLRCLHDLGPP
jgi:hypothetical protein